MLDILTEHQKKTGTHFSSIVDRGGTEMVSLVVQQVRAPSVQLGIESPVRAEYILQPFLHSSAHAQYSALDNYSSIPAFL